MMTKFSIKSFRFFAAGKGLSFRTGKYLGESILVGLLVGFVVVGFRLLIDIVHGQLVLGLLVKTPTPFATRLVASVLPALGALLGYLLIRRFSSVAIARGTDSAVKAYHQHGGYIPGATIPVKSVASVLTVASGGSAGYEGPVTLIGAAVGSVIGRWLNLTVRARRILMAAGLAAGIGALFQAPLAGAIFGFEIFYSSSDVEYETLLPSFVASAVAYTVFAYFFGWGSLFTMPDEIAYNSGLRLLPYFVLAVAIVFGARFYISFFRSTERSFAEMRLPASMKVVVGGLVTGLIGWFFPGVLGTSYGVIQASLNEQTVSVLGCLAFFLMKVVATAFTVGSGGSGGVFAPALVCGGCLGSALGLFFARVLPASFGIHPAAFALVGMAGFLASAVRIPMTAIVIVAEISGNHGLLLPAMWVCGIAFWLNNGWSLYRSQPHSRETSPVHM